MFPIYDENPAIKHPPTVNMLIIWVNLVVFILEVFYVFGASTLVTVTQGSASTWCLVPSRFLHHFDIVQFATVFTAMFMHAGLEHIIGNLWVLWIFGDNVEDKLGHFNYLMFYLGCGILAAAAHIASDPTSTVPLLGASGAIAGVLGAYLMLYPDAKVKMWIFWFWRPFWPAWIVIGGWFLLNCFDSVTVHDEVAYIAHIGGFYAGVFFLYLFTRHEGGETAGDQKFRKVFASKKTVALMTLATCIVFGCGYAVHAWEQSLIKEASASQAVHSSKSKQATAKRVTSKNSAKQAASSKAQHTGGAVHRHAKHKSQK